MIKNKILYLNEKEYNNLKNMKDVRVKKLKKIVIGENPKKNKEILEYIFQELNIEYNFEEYFNTNYSAIADVLSDIPGELPENIRGVYLFIENINNIDEKFINVLKSTIIYFEKEIIYTGAEVDFPLSFDIFIKEP